MSTPGPEAASPRTVRPEFTGSAREYFRIWIVNLFFTLVTLGVYSAWAKVRKKRYFYGCTRFDGDTFDYFASPKTILKGRIVAVALFVVYAFASEIYPPSIWAFWALFLLALPWLVVRTLAFNARNSAWRGLRFDFTATNWPAARMYIGFPLLVLVTGGLAYPWFMARQKAFVVSRHAFGTTRLECRLSAGSFYGTYVLAGLLLVILIVPLVFLGGLAMAQWQVPANLAWVPVLAMAGCMYVAYALSYAFIQARTTNLTWNGTQAQGMRFASTLEGGKLARIYIGNVLASAASAGLLIPWAVVRTLRYRLESFSVAIEGDNVHQANPALERVGATGQEFGDIFNLDFGL